MALRVDIVAELNERAATAAANRLKGQMTRAGEVSGEAFRAALEKEAQRSKIATDKLQAELRNQFAKHGEHAGLSFGAGFGAQMARSLPGVSGFTSAMAGYEGAAAKSGALAGRALGLAFTTAAGGLIGAAGYTLFKGFERYEAIDTAKNRLDNLNRTLAATGKETVNVAAVMETVNQVVLDTPFKLDQAFSIATRALGSHTGDLKRFMTDVSDAAGYAAAPLDSIGEAFLKIANQGKLSMEEVQNELRDTNILGWLQDSMHKSGAEVAKMIHDGKVGLEEVLKAVESGAAGFAKASGNTIKGQIEIMSATVSRAGANFIGAIFGKPAEQGNELLGALKSVNDRLRDVDAWVKAHQQEIHDFFKNAAEVAGELGKVLGTIARALAEHKDLIYGVVMAYGAWKSIEGVAALISSLQTINTLLGVTLPASAASGAAAMSAALAPILASLASAAALFNMHGSGPSPNIGPGAGDRQAKLDAGKKYFDQNHQMPPGYQQWLDSGGQMPKEMEPFYRAPGSTPFFDSQGRPLKADGTPFGPSIPGPYDPNVPKSVLPGASGAPGPHGGPIQPPSGAAGGGQGQHLPKAPVVPYDTALPPGFSDLPMSSGLYSAESSYLDNRHKLAEKQARLAQLEKDGAATEQDVLDARNDVVTAGRDLQQAEMRLYEERASIFGKHNKQIKSWLSELGDIGASLDQDFGISKGLAGIAENITKFIANLAAAPILGQLGASQIAAGFKPGEAGQGLMGALAAGGAFGSQYQIRGSAFGGGQGAQGVYYSGGRGGYPGDAALLAGVPAGRYDASGDLSRGLGDCSSAVEDLVNIMDGRPTAGRSMSTGNAAQWLSQHGFIPGMGGLGDFRVGFNGGHMQATLPGGTPFNWGSDAAAANRGIGGTGADDPSFTSHYYRPGGGAPSGGPSLSLPGLSGPATSAGPAAGPTPGGRGGAVGPGTATQWRTNADGSKTGLDAAGNATGDYIPSGGPGGALSVAPSGMGGPGGIPRAPGGPQPGVPGPGLPGLPYTSNPTKIGGVPPPQGTGSGGVGLGGMAMAGIQAGIGAAGMAGAPFGGQAGAAAAQAMMELANRGIKFASEAAGIGVQGLAETFLPAGSELANNNWITKIAGGVAGAMPMLPNVAGKGGEDGSGPTPEQVVGQGQGPYGRPAGLPDPAAAGNTDQSKNVSITNNNTFNAANYSENSMANSIASAQQASYTR